MAVTRIEFSATASARQQAVDSLAFITCKLLTIIELLLFLSSTFTPIQKKMGIDLILLQETKGGDLAAVKQSQARRFAPEGLVDEVLVLYRAWTVGELRI